MQGRGAANGDIGEFGYAPLMDDAVQRLAADESKATIAAQHNMILPVARWKSNGTLPGAAAVSLSGSCGAAGLMGTLDFLLLMPPEWWYTERGLP